MHKLILTAGDLKFYQKIITHPLGYIIVPALLGLSATLGLAPYNSWPCSLAALILLFLILTVQVNKKGVFFSCLAFFTAYQAISLWWLNFVMQDFGQLPALLTWTVVILFGAYLALPYALFSALAFKWGKKSVIAFNLALLPLACIAADYVENYLFTGFPWTYVGYSAIEGPLAAYAPLLGVRGINFLLYLAAGSVTLTILRQFIYLPAAGVIIVLAVLIRGISFTSEADDAVPLTLVQGNIEQSVRWRKEMVAPTLITYWDLSKTALNEGRTVIWPESAIPLFTRDALPFLQDLNAVALGHGGHLITGIQHLEIDEQTGKKTANNSIIALGEQEAIEDALDLQRYDKRHLVPFGEFVPFADLLRPLGSIFNFPMSNFTKGAAEQSPIKVGTLILNPAICYESVFAELIASLDAPEVSGIIMLSNDSWFGPTRGPQQHLAIARMRCLELQKPMIRVTNSGITAILGADGTVQAILPSNEEGVLEYDFKGYAGATLYSRLGEIPLLILMALIALWGWRKLKVGQSPEEAAMLRLLRP